MNKKSIFQAVEQADPHGIAVEALIQAETQFMTNDFDSTELEDDDGFAQMAYKDDDGFWRVTGSKKKYLNCEELTNDFPDLV